MIDAALIGARQRLDSFLPFMAGLSGRGMPALDPCFFGVATRAERLQITWLIGKGGVRPDRFDMIDFQSPTFAALLAAKPIAFEDLHAQNLPAFCCCHALGMALMGHDQDTRAFRVGAAFIRAPCATARTAAAAASILPRERPLASA